MPHRKLIINVLVTAFLLFGISTPLFSDSSEQEAKVILKTAGIKPGPGLCVHLGCGNGKLTAALAEAGGFLVHGLDPDKTAVAAARKYIESKGLTTKVSIESGSMKKLPYAENLVNLLVAESLPALVKKGLPLKEVMRVVCPNGVLICPSSLKSELAKAGFQDIKTVTKDLIKATKPRPEGMDTWLQRGRGADGNRVSQDQLVEVPKSLRWVAGPKWPYGSRKNCGKGIVASERRLFAVQSFFDGKQLIARDAYNGVLLWNKPIIWASRGSKPIGRGATMSFSLPLIAAGGRIYTILKKDIVGFSGATGDEEVRIETGAPLGGGDELAYTEGTLILTTETDVQAYEEPTSKLRWKYAAKAVDLAADSKNVFFLEVTSMPYELVALDLATGKEKWRTSTEKWGPWPPVKGAEGKLLALCFLARDKIILAASSGGKSGGENASIYAVSAQDGTHVWTHKYSDARSLVRYEDAFFVQGLVWVYHCPARVRGAPLKPRLWKGLDLATGEVKRRIETRWRAKCGSYAVTDRYLSNPKDFAFLDLKTEKNIPAGTVVAACVIGWIPANGMIYNPQIACSCNPATVPGFQGIAGAVPDKENADKGTGADERLEKGPAYGKGNGERGARNDEWPTYRHDPMRTGSTAADVPAALELVWKTPVATAKTGPPLPLWEEFTWDRITSPVAGDGKVFAADINGRRVIALDAQNGRHVWTYETGGRIDSPPTISGGLCLFGSRDGYVYCVRAKD
jgi:outer membrane protein assembly factor BamB